MYLAGSSATLVLDFAGFILNEVIGVERNFSFFVA